MEPDSKLDEFNRIEALRVIWTTLSKLALKTESISSKNYFRLFGIGSYGEDSFCHQAFQDCNDAGLIPNSVHNPDYGPFKHIVLKVFYSALNMGLVLPSNLGQSLPGILILSRFILPQKEESIFLRVLFLLMIQVIWGSHSKFCNKESLQ